MTDTNPASSDSTGASLPRFFYPGERLADDQIRVTVLGSGGPFSRRGQAAPSMLIELGDGQLFIMDFGSGALANLNGLEVPQGRVTKIFLTHLHCDHWSDLAQLHAVNYMYGSGAPLEIWGPSGAEPRLGTAAWATAFEAMMAWDIESRRGEAASAEAAHLRVHEFDFKTAAWIYDQDGVRIKAFPALHSLDGPVSYRLEWNDLTFVFSGDTKPTRFFVENAQDADLLIHDTFPSAALYAQKSGLPLWVTRHMVNGVHSPPNAAGKVFALTKPRLAVMYHLRIANIDRVEIMETMRREYEGPAVIAEDLMVFNVSREHVVQRLAVVPDFPDPIAGRDPSDDVSRFDPAPISSWLTDAEIPVDTT